MKIHSNFIGGNITVINQNGNDIYLENQLRDTTEDWFYFAFCVEGAEGKELNFHFKQNNRLGYFGPAVSHDLKNWKWLNNVNGESFTYKFGKTENKVFFAHSMLYHPERFLHLADELKLSIKELCKSRKGRSVPSVQFGDGNKSIILTARHHACESTGSYVLEGVLREFAERPVDDVKILCVPFVDYDGVTDGDQGKARYPHDHNRDYNDESIYPETSAIREYADKNGCNYGFDFHSPWHKGGENDNIFIVRNSIEKLERIERFSRILEKEITADSMKYSSANDHPPMTTWNKQPNFSFGYTMMHRKECDLALSLETAYFGTADDKISAEKMIEFGRCYAKAIKKYMA